MSEKRTAQIENEKKTIVLVEPVCRGSRLHWLAMITAVLQNYYRVIIVTRADYMSDHFEELMKKNNFDLFPVPNDYNGQWLPDFSSEDLRQILAVIKKIDESIASSYDLFFLALDDYTKAFFLTRGLASSLKNADRRFAVRYRCQSLVSNLLHPRAYLIKTILNYGCRAWNINLITLDERLENKAFAGKKMFWLPDPWIGEFENASKISGRKLFGYEKDEFVMLAIGRQDSRKGIAFLIKAMPAIFHTIQNAKLCICGKISPQFQKSFDRLYQKFPDRIHHVKEFIPEQQLPDVFSMASVVLLPYAPEFTTTSGVLPRAAAAGTPVLVSSHGLIAYRVNKYKCGEVFDFGNEEQFIEKIRILHDSEKSKVFADGLQALAHDFSVNEFNKELEKIFQII